MRLTQEQKLHKTIRWLRKTFPPGLPVYTAQVQLTKLCGDCSLHSSFRLEKDYFLIRINAANKYEVKADTILHEWAHVLTWFDTELEPHGNTWGEAYARIYRAWLKWDFGKGGIP